jgi:DNA-binding HxlR family transcriptional regulator
MSKKNQKYGNLLSNLPKLQKKIVLCLARDGAMTMSDTNRKIKGLNTSTTRAFHELETKEMVTKTGIEPYRGREFSKYWLSPKGLAFAMLNDANPESAKRIALSFNQNDEEKKAIEVYFGLRSLSPRIANVLDGFVLLAGKLDPEELLKQLLPVMVSLDKTEMKRLFDKAREFPDYWKHTLETLTKFSDTIKKMKDE